MNHENTERAKARRAEIESVSSVHSAAGRDHAADGRDPPAGGGGVPPTAGVGLAAGGLPTTIQALTFYPGRQPRRHGVVGHGSAGAPSSGKWPVSTR